jgi:hypothetical protein
MQERIGETEHAIYVHLNGAWDECRGQEDRLHEYLEAFLGPHLLTAEGYAALLGASEHGSQGGEEYTSRGPCGYVFESGDPIYRCRHCGLDETCVMCVKCFKATGHDGHDISFSVATGSGGCCDCGDPEAWTVPLDCRFHCPSDRGSGAMDVSLKPMPEVIS